MKIIPAVIFTFTCNFLLSQNNRILAPSGLSIHTQNVLDSLHSCSKSDKTPLEFSTIGEGSRPSHLFKLYSLLVSTAKEGELLAILANQKEKPFVRGYAYMAYLYKCESEKKREKPLSYRFTLTVTSGCITSDYTFNEFKEKVHSPRNYCNPNNIFIDNEENAVIKKENELRKEQGIPLRKE